MQLDLKLILNYEFIIKMEKMEKIKKNYKNKKN